MANTSLLILNETLNNLEIQTDYDFFKNIYSNPLLNYSMVLIYTLGFIGVSGLILVVWFERSGQAGPYRTLINRLVSYNINQVCIKIIILDPMHSAVTNTS